MIVSFSIKPGDQIDENEYLGEQNRLGKQNGTSKKVNTQAFLSFYKTFP